MGVSIVVSVMCCFPSFFNALSLVMSVANSNWPILVASVVACLTALLGVDNHHVSFGYSLSGCFYSIVCSCFRLFMLHVNWVSQMLKHLLSIREFATNYRLCLSFLICRV